MKIYTYSACFLFISISLGLLSARAQNAASNKPVDPILKIADSLFFKREWAKAKANYTTYLKANDKSSLAWNRLGFCNQNLKLNDEAIADYQKSLANNPPPGMTGTVYARLAMVYSIKNNIDESAMWLEKVGSTAFDMTAQVDSLEEFKNVRLSGRLPDIKKKIAASLYPCMNLPKAHDFDFWIGEWVVYQTGTKNLAGHSVIQTISGGCAILENWTSTQTYVGKSVNYFNTETDKWEQDWVGSGGGGDHQRFLNGEYKDGVMHFTYTKVVKGKNTSGNFMFYNIDKDTVRQFQDVLNDDGKTYSTVYDLTYIRKK